MQIINCVNLNEIQFGVLFLINLENHLNIRILKDMIHPEMLTLKMSTK